jgi:hypothetical protein
MQILLAFLLCLFASPVYAAITYDTQSSTSVNGGSSTSHSHTVAADANIAVVCLAIRDDGGAVAAATGVTIGGDAMTRLRGETHSGNIIRAELWYRLAPLTGSQTVAVTGAVGTDRIVTGVMTFKGVAQSNTWATDADGAVGQGSSTNMDVDSIASALGEMGVFCGASRGLNQTASPDGTAPVVTERVELCADCSGGTLLGYSATEDGAATSINMRVDLTVSATWVAVGASMQAAATSTRRPIAPMVFQ